jgi:hypothetical protein
MGFWSVFRPALVIVGTALVTMASAAAPGERLSFDVSEGLNLNSFLRSGPVAAHLLLRSGTDPRILIAFPAGNSGVGLWFARSNQRVSWMLQGRPEPVTLTDERGRPLYGMVAQVNATGPEQLSIKQAVLSSVRVLRDYEVLGTAPAEVLVSPVIHGDTIIWARDRLDGAAGYRLSLQVLHGEMQAGRISAGRDGQIALMITALSGETPLTPLPGEDLLNAHAAPDAEARNVLTFLSYREKFLAGSWRFNTYFGRDTLMSLRLLLPALTPAAVEAGLGAVLTRLSPEGEVAHEEDIGEFAILDRLRAGDAKSDAPTFNYNMIDGNFMLAPVASAWLLDDARGRAGAAAFLAHSDNRYPEAPRAYGADLVTNLRLVIQSAVAFAERPRVPYLIELRKGFTTGQWRDSGEGLGRGRYPYDVNAVFVPAALAAAGRVFASGLLDPFLNAEDRALFARAPAMARIWEAKAGPLFETERANATARRDVEVYAASLGIPPDAAEASLGKEPVRFHAIALDAHGLAVPILHSDEGFELLFGHPSPTAVDQAMIAMMRPFPAGLLTDVGVVVADPVFATPEVQARFSKNAYHGAVVWSWQQAVLAAGLARQLRRSDLPAPVKRRLLSAQAQLWRAIDAGRTVRSSELWSWNYADGQFHVAPFGASGADVDESNAAQLWSTVYLAIAPPTAPSR